MAQKKRTGPKPRPVMERIEDSGKTRSRGYETPCRVACGGLSDGYGQITIGSASDGSRRKVRMHLVVWEYHHGPVPDGLEIHHLCGQKDCHEITHLKAVTHRENLMLSPTTITSINANKTHCAKGHPYAGENLGWSKRGRLCITCEREWAATSQRRFRQRKRIA